MNYRKMLFNVGYWLFAGGMGALMISVTVAALGSDMPLWSRVGLVTLMVVNLVVHPWIHVRCALCDSKQDGVVDIDATQQP